MSIYFKKTKRNTDLKKTKTKTNILISMNSFNQNHLTYQCITNRDGESHRNGG